MFALSWAIAGALATVAGVFVSTGAGVDQQLWIIALKALPVIILGGLDSLGGAVIAGLAIGVVEDRWSPPTERTSRPGWAASSPSSHRIW